jgi:hypothetical protein
MHEQLNDINYLRRAMTSTAVPETKTCCSRAIVAEPQISPAVSSYYCFDSARPALIPSYRDNDNLNLRYTYHTLLQWLQELGQINGKRFDAMNVRNRFSNDEETGANKTGEQIYKMQMRKHNKLLDKTNTRKNGMNNFKIKKYAHSKLNITQTRNNRTPDVLE